MVVDHATGRKHPGVVDILRIPDLHGVKFSEGVFDIGAATTFNDLLNHTEIQARIPILSEAAGTVGAWQIQNRSTIGGNIANASPAGDSLPVLLALNADLVLAGPGGERTISYDQMHSGYRKTALAPGELIVRVRIPEPTSDTRQYFNKVGTREAQAISKLVMAFTAKVHDGNLHNVRVGAGSIAATPIRLTESEKFLEGKVANSETADAVARVAEGEVHPIDDVRSSAEYRSYVVGTVLRRFILNCAGNS